MFHIFEPLRAEMIPRFIGLGKKFLVTQQYHLYYDHFSDEAKTSLLVTTYGDSEIARAHLGAVQHDKFACIIDLGNQKHLSKLAEMLQPGSKYNLFWAAVADPEMIKKRLGLKYKDHIRRYINKNTTWRIGGDEKIRPDIQLIFGELFVIIKRGKEVLRIKFEELEKA
jgi:hypothetical protein